MHQAQATREFFQVLEAEDFIEQAQSGVAMEALVEGDQAGPILTAMLQGQPAAIQVGGYRLVQV